MAEPTRDDAWDLVCEWIDSDSLRKHVLGVEAAMRAYARDGGEDEELWAITGLVHDLDYERYPDLDTGHPRYALKELEARGYPAGGDRRGRRPRRLPRRAPRDAAGEDAVRRSTSSRASSPPARWCAPPGSRA